jgi:hypothetical protein
MARTEYTVTSLPFVVDHNSVTQNSGRQIDWDNVRRADAVLVTADGTNAQGATSLGVEALPGPIPSGTTLRFGADEYATSTSAAAEGATSIAVAALVNAIEDGDTALYAGVGLKSLSAGTVMVEISASKKICPRASRPGSETAVGLLASGAHQDSKSDAVTGYGLFVGGVIYQNLLPEGTPNGTVKTELNAAGTGFAWEDYSNDAD